MSHETRAPQEALTDTILFLCLMDRVGELGFIGDRIKVQKVTFLATHEMWRRKDKGFNLTFFRWHYGPFSKQLYATWDDLKHGDTDFLREEEWFSITPSGQDLARAFREEVLCVSENQTYWSVLDSIARRTANRSGSAIQREVYEMKVHPIRHAAGEIRGLPLLTQLTEALDPSEANTQLRIEAGWLETLAIALNPAATTSLARAVRDFAENRFTCGAPA